MGVPLCLLDLGRKSITRRVYLCAKIMGSNQETPVGYPFMPQKYGQ